MRRSCHPLRFTSTLTSIRPFFSSPSFLSSSPSPKFNDNLTLNDFLSQNKNIKTMKTTSHRQESSNNSSLKFFIETYGCQMNVSDSEIVRSVLLDAGHVVCETVESADIILANTCAIRENAEAKVWHRLHYFKSIKNKNKIGKLKPGSVLFILLCLIPSDI
jgi:hypothetical protein